MISRANYSCRYDTISSFFGKCKRSAWASWDSYSEATEAFIYITEHPYETIHFTSSHFFMLERFTVILCHKVSALLAMKLAGNYSARRTKRIFLPLRMPFSSCLSGKNLDHQSAEYPGYSNMG